MSVTTITPGANTNDAPMLVHLKDGSHAAIVIAVMSEYGNTQVTVTPTTGNAIVTEIESDGTAMQRTFMVYSNDNNPATARVDVRYKNALFTFLTKYPNVATTEYGYSGIYFNNGGTNPYCVITGGDEEVFGYY